MCHSIYGWCLLSTRPKVFHFSFSLGDVGVFKKMGAYNWFYPDMIYTKPINSSLFTLLRTHSYWVLVYRDRGGGKCSHEWRRILVGSHIQYFLYIKPTLKESPFQLLHSVILWCWYLLLNVVSVIIFVAYDLSCLLEFILIKLCWTSQE